MLIIRRALSLIVLIAALLAAGESRVERAGAEGFLAMRSAPSHDARRERAAVAAHSGSEGARCSMRGIDGEPPAIGSTLAGHDGADIAWAHGARAPPVPA